MAKIVTFGEIMLRLAPPVYERTLQSPMFVATFGGGEANVAVSTANYGLPSSFVTAMPPDHAIADACLNQLRSFGIDVGQVIRKPGRLGPGQWSNLHAKSIRQNQWDIVSAALTKC